MSNRLPYEEKRAVALYNGLVAEIKKQEPTELEIMNVLQMLMQPLLISLTDHAVAVASEKDRKKIVT